MSLAHTQRWLALLLSRCACRTPLHRRQLVTAPTLLQVRDDAFHHVRPIAKGGYGQVWCSVKRDSGTLFAVKFLSRRRLVGDAAQHALDEVRVLRSVRSEFVCALHYAYATKECLCLVLGWYPGGSLAYHLKMRREEVGACSCRQSRARVITLRLTPIRPTRQLSQPEVCQPRVAVCAQVRKGSREVPFTEDAVRFYAASILLGLEALHVAGVVYRDLKPDNVLLDRGGTVKLTDFGLALCLGAHGTANSKAGTRGYWAPEVIRRQPYRFEPDFWSLGAQRCHRCPTCRVRVRVHGAPRVVASALRAACACACTAHRAWWHPRHPQSTLALAVRTRTRARRTVRGGIRATHNRRSLLLCVRGGVCTTCIACGVCAGVTVHALLSLHSPFSLEHNLRRRGVNFDDGSCSFVVASGFGGDESRDEGSTVASTLTSTMISGAAGTAAAATTDQASELRAGSATVSGQAGSSPVEAAALVATARRCRSAITKGEPMANKKLLRDKQRHAIHDHLILELEPPPPECGSLSPETTRTQRRHTHASVPQASLHHKHTASANGHALCASACGLFALPGLVRAPSPPWLSVVWRRVRCTGTWESMARRCCAACWTRTPRRASVPAECVRSPVTPSSQVWICARCVRES